MSEQEKNGQQEAESTVQNEAAEAQAEGTATAEETANKETQEVSELDAVKAELEKQKKEYMFLLAEFDNFRKRTLKEKQELIKNAAEGAMKSILPVIDDFERAKQAIEGSDDIEGLREGVELIYNKFIKYLESNGVKPIESDGCEFNTEFHEAVTTFPTDDENLKGKVIDTVQKGYTMNEKVIRHSKVVVGQ